MWVLPSAPRLHSNSHPAFIAGRTQVRTWSFLLSGQKMKIKLQLVALQDLVINELKIPFLLKEGWAKQSWIYPQFCKMQAAEWHLRKPLKLNNFSEEILSAEAQGAPAGRAKPLSTETSEQGLKGGSKTQPKILQLCLQQPQTLLLLPAFQTCLEHPFTCVSDCSAHKWNTFKYVCTNLKDNNGPREVAFHQAITCVFKITE